MDQIVKKTDNKKNSTKKLSDKPSREEAEEAVRTLIKWAGDDPKREGLIDTPGRVTRAYEEMYEGYGKDPDKILGTTFEEVAGYDEMVIVKDIDFESHCEHHMVPIVGYVHVGYLPDRRVLGLSKMARVVDIFAKRLQTQETMTAQIAEAIQNKLEPQGVAVMIEAEHMCMTMRGARKKRSITTTTSFTGEFKKQAHQQLHFMTLTRRDSESK